MRFMLRDIRGSVVVEAAFIFSFLSILTVGCIEYGQWFANQSQVDRVSYSISSLIRERTLFYNKREAFSQDDVKQLYEMAKYLTYHQYDSGLCIRVESVFFASEASKKISSYQSLNYGSKICNNLKITSLKEKVNLSPFSSRQRWLPLYQVTLVVPSPKGNLDKLLKMVNVLPENIISHNIVLVR